MGQLENRVALVTGGASGLGRAISQRLLADGAHVVIADIQVEVGKAAAIEDGSTFVEHDVRKENDWASIIRQMEESYGGLAILVNNAGILGPTDAVNPENGRLEDWRTIFSVNVEGVFLGCRAAIPPMRQSGGGVIVNISSVAGLLATPYAMAYGASKAAVLQLTRSVAQHCARENIRCNVVLPGNVSDPTMRAASMWQRYAQKTAEERGISIAQLVTEASDAIPMGSLTRAEDVAAAVAFLASNDARHITGERLVVDGGIVSCDTYRSGSGG